MADPLTRCPAVDIFLTRPEVIFKSFISCSVFEFEGSESLTVGNFLPRRVVCKNGKKYDEQYQIFREPEGNSLTKVEFRENGQPTLEILQQPSDTCEFLVKILNSGPSYNLGDGQLLQEKLNLWHSKNVTLNSEKETIKLVDKEFYAETFNRIKSLLAGEIIQNWNESTDPRKYVFEDVAIAAYIFLLLHWGWSGKSDIHPRNQISVKI